MASEKSVSPIPLYKRRWFLIPAFLAISLVLFFVTLPIGAKWYITRWLERNGAEEASIEHLWFNPLTFELVAEGISVKDQDKTLLSNSKMVINLSPWPLFRKDVDLQRVMYQNLFLEINQNDDGSWDFGSYHYAPEKDSMDDTADKAASHWDLFAEQVVFENIMIALKTKNLDFKLVIDKGELHKIATWDDGPVGTLQLEGSLNETPFSIDLSQVTLIPEFNIVGNISFNAFQLNQLTGLLSDPFSRFAGTTDIAGNISVKQADNESLRGMFNGKLAFREIDIASSDFETSAQHIEWLGKAEYAIDPANHQTITADGSLELGRHHFNLNNDQTAMKGEGAIADGNVTVKVGEIVSIAYNGTLETQATEVRLPGSVVGEEQLSWDGEIHYISQTEETANAVTTDGSLEISDLSYTRLDSGSESFSVKSHINWSGKLLFDQPASTNLLDVQGNIAATDTHISLGSPNYSIEAPQNTFDFSYQLAIGDTFETKGQGSATLEKIAVLDATTRKQIAGVDKVNIAALKGLGEKGLESENVEASAIHLSLPGQLPIEINLEKITLSKAKTADFTNFDFSEITLSTFQTRAEKTGREIAAFEILSLSDITLGSTCDLSIHSGYLQDLLILAQSGDETKQPALTLDNANLFSLCYKSDEIPHIDTLYLTDLKASFHRNSSGELDITNQLEQMMEDKEALQGSEKKAADDASSEPLALPLYFREFVVKGDSHINFIDDTLPKQFNSQLGIQSLELLGFDSDAIDQEIQLTFTGELEQRAPVTLTGTISPFTEQKQLYLKFNLKNYPLKNLSGFTIKDVGTELASGQLQIDSIISLDGKMLDMENDLLLKKLETTIVSENLAEEIHNQLPIPLDAALSMLRDSDDNISLNIPVSGAIDEIDVDITDLILTAMSKAIIPAATGYLTYALGPYAALAYVGYKVGEKALQINLPSILYENQQTDIPKEQEKYLDKVASVLKDKKESDLQLCPWISAGELTPVDQSKDKAQKIELNKKSISTLEQLGQERAENLKRYFVTNHSIKGSRLLICDTTIVEDEKAPSEVRLQL
ncbi:MAG: DUF748 domain-containing protein [Desulfopila sp.]|jgi:hypothetical protein|nr:DUF748 domain-containing protein [Desulfopila sp.]